MHSLDYELIVHFSVSLELVSDVKGIVMFRLHIPRSVTALVQDVEMLVAAPQLFCSLVHVSDTLIANKQDVIHDAAASAPALPISVRLFGSVHLCLHVDFQRRIYA